MFYVILMIWIACGIIGYSGTLGHFQKKWNVYNLPRENRGSDMLLALIVGLAGPIGLFPVTFLSNFFEYGFLFAPLSDELINRFGDEQNQFRKY